ncbi:MAG: phage portal protein [Anaerovoracaceae bacterium]
MGVFDYIKGVFGKTKENKYAAWLSNSRPIFSSFGKDIYLSDFVNNAIDRVASEISKIDIKSIVERPDEVKVQNDELTRLFRYKPNPLQTTSDFLSSIEWLRRKNRNAFIYPQYVLIKAGDRVVRKYIAFYPLNPSSIAIGQNNGEAWEVQLTFLDGKSFTLPYEDLIHLKWRRGTNTIIGGGDDYGEANDYDIIRTIDALDKTIQGLPKSIEASMQIKGVYTSKSLMDEKRREEERTDFESHIMKSRSGIVAVDLAGDFTPINITVPDIPGDALKFLKSVVQERYGISAAILAGDFTSTQHNAFYQTAIEDFIVQMEQAFTACIFTQREQDVGRKIKGYYRKVRYYSTADKLNLAEMATRTRLMTLNQINEMFGIEPFEGGDVRLQSLNYVDSAIANQYQMSKDKSRKEDEPEGTQIGGDDDEE